MNKSKPVITFPKWGVYMLIFMLTPLLAYAVEDKLSVFTLPNGLKVFVQEDHARKVATVQIWTMVGSADEAQKELGISHLIEHMAFKGTERRGVGKIASEIEGLGGETNAYTSWDETVFHVTVPASKVSEGIDILTDAVFRPTIDPAELDKEKQVVIEEILEGEERPERKASKLLFRTAYTDHPYKDPIIGYKDVVAGFTQEDVLNFRKKWYVTENMFIVVVGDVDPAKVVADVQKYTADIKPTGFFRLPRPTEPPQKEVRTGVLQDRNARETRLFMAFHIPSMKGQDVNALDLTGDILGARNNSRLVRSLKKEKGLVNSIAAYAMTPKDPGLLAISATLDAKNIEPVIAAIMEEIEKLKKTPPTPQELEEAKVHIESQHFYARETVQGVARDLGNYQADMGDAQYVQKYLTLNRAVQAVEISDALKRYVAPSNLTVSILTPEETEAMSADNIKRLVSNGAAQKTEAKQEASAKEEQVVTTLPNGIRVVLEPDSSNQLLSVRIAFLGGKRFETKQTEGIMNFISQMLDKGTKNLDEVEIAKQVDEIGGRLGGFSGYDSFGLSMAFFSRYYDKGLSLLGDLYKNVAFPAEVLDRERALILNRIRTEPDRPVVFAINTLNAAVFPNHPYGFNKEGTLATVSGFTSQDLKDAYDRYAVPSNMVITVVGDMDVKKVLAKITDIFGGIPARKLDKPEIPKEEPITAPIEKVVKIPRAKAHIALGFKGVALDELDRYPMEVLNNMLAGQGGKLFQELRDKQSLAYTVTSFVRPGLDPGMFAFYIATEDAKAPKAVEGLYSEINKVRTQPISEEDVTHSKENLIGNHYIALQSSWARAENTVLNTLYGLGPNYDPEYVKKINEVKPEDVSRVARKYLDPQHAALVKILPDTQETN